MESKDNQLVSQTTTVSMKKKVEGYDFEMEKVKNNK